MTNGYAAHWLPASTTRFLPAACFGVFLVGLLLTTAGYTQTPALSLTVSNALSCNQLSTTLTATASCTGGMTYAFNGPNDFTLTNTSGVVSVSVNGAYSVTATSADGLCTAVASATVSSSLHPDYLPLVDLFNSTRGSGWVNRTGWLTNCDPCSGWNGLTCENGRVTRISLLFNKLTGRIPETIGQLQALSLLALPYNQLTGTLPASLSSLTNLSTFWVQDNQLTGGIPPQYDQLKKLAIFNVANNQLTGPVPTGLTSLTGLVQFWVGSNQLSGSLPTSWSSLTSLASLNLGLNRFSPGPIPAEIGRLPNLTDLFMDRCNLTGAIPAEFSQLSRLSSLYLSGNSLTGQIPAFLGSLTALRSIVLSYNQLVGAIPSSIGALPQLTTFVVESNRLSGCIPASLTALCGKDVRIGANPNLPNGGDWAAFCASGAGTNQGTATSTQAGLWHAPSTWSCGVSPRPGQRVFILHPLVVATGQLNEAGQVRYLDAGKLLYQSGGTLHVHQ